MGTGWEDRKSERIKRDFLSDFPDFTDFRTCSIMNRMYKRATQGMMPQVPQPGTKNKINFALIFILFPYV